MRTEIGRLNRHGCMQKQQHLLQQAGKGFGRDNSRTTGLQELRHVKPFQVDRAMQDGSV